MWLDETSQNEKIFKQFCFFVDENITRKKEGNSPLGFLVIIDKFVSSEQLVKLKELLKFKNTMNKLEFINSFFHLKFDKV